MNNENDIKINDEENIEIGSKEKETMDYAKRLVGQTIRKIANSGKVQKLNGQVLEIDVNSKEQLKAAVKLQIIRPYTSASKIEYSLEWKEQIKDLIKSYDEIFEEEYKKYLKNNESIKDFKTSENETNLKDKNDESTIEPSIISPSLLEASKKLNELIKRIKKPVERVYVGKIDIKAIKPFTVIDGKRNTSLGKIGKLQDRYNVAGRENKPKESVLDIRFSDEKEDIAK